MAIMLGMSAWVIINQIRMTRKNRKKRREAEGSWGKLDKRTGEANT
jgi:hypothetical protein